MVSDLTDFPTQLPDANDQKSSNFKDSTMARGTSWHRVFNIRVQRLRTGAMRHPMWRDQVRRARLLRNLALSGVLFCLLCVVGVSFAFIWFSKDLPRPDRIQREEGFATKLLDRNGELLYEIFVEQQRTPVSLEQVPMTVQQATVAIEDKNFYSHGGFDSKGIIRAMINTIFLGNTQGGSTLTQQLVKNVLLTNERTVTRKIKELVLSIQIESQYNKDEILQMYLNEAPYGGTAWGIATAAQTYFGKPVSDLTLVESAILAGMPQRPSVYTPYGKYPDAYIARTQGVLRRMKEDGYITEDEEASASASLSEVSFSRAYSSIRAPHFSLFVKDLLEEQFSESLVQKGGLKVTTTLDVNLHDFAQTAVSEEIARLAESNAGVGNGAALVMDPTTGEILSMVGSKDFFADDYDGQVNVVNSLRQPGSSIKPVTFAAAFAKGYTPAHVLMDVPTEFPSGDGKSYNPQNYDGTFRGPVQLRFALGSSLNIPAVKLLALIGIEDMLSLASDMGFSTLAPTDENLARFGLSVTLGGGDVRLMDMVTAYSAFGNGGTKIEPVAILQVEDRNGNVLFDHKPVKGRRVLDEGVAFLVNHVLSDDNARAPTFGRGSQLNLAPGTVAVKTGTTNDRRDNWTVGWSETGIVGVWVGNNDNSPMNRVASGVTGASPIWRKIMAELLKSYPAEFFTPPNNVEAVLVDVISGYPEHDGYPARSEYVIRGTLPPLPDPIHTKLKLCRGQLALAGPVLVERGDFDEREFYSFQEDVQLGDVPNWQVAIDGWTSQQADEKYRPPKDYCDEGGEAFVKIEQPKDRVELTDTQVNFDIRVTANSQVDRVIILVNGEERETLISRPYLTTLDLPAGRYKLQARAKLQNGQEVDSSEITIGTGGVPWIEPSPVPSPTLSPTIEPVVSLTPGLTPEI